MQYAFCILPIIIALHIALPFAYCPMQYALNCIAHFNCPFAKSLMQKFGRVVSAHTLSAIPVWVYYHLYLLDPEAVNGIELESPDLSEQDAWLMPCDHIRF